MVRIFHRDGVTRELEDGLELAVQPGSLAQRAAGGGFAEPRGDPRQALGAGNRGAALQAVGSAPDASRVTGVDRPRKLADRRARQLDEPRQQADASLVVVTEDVSESRRIDQRPVQLGADRPAQRVVANGNDAFSSAQASGN